MNDRIVVSACLAGIKCRYDGSAKPCQAVIDLVKNNKAVTVCPEQLGGLPTPRIAAERIGNKVIGKDGSDLTEKFELGAKKALEIVKEVDADQVILKTKSPSCGLGKIYDGSFSGKLVKGNGVFADLCLKNGVEVKTEEET